MLHTAYRRITYNTVTRIGAAMNAGTKQAGLLAVDCSTAFLELKSLLCSQPRDTPRTLSGQTHSHLSSKTQELWSLFSLLKRYVILPSPIRNAKRKQATLGVQQCTAPCCPLCGPEQLPLASLVYQAARFTLGTLTSHLLIRHANSTVLRSASQPYNFSDDSRMEARRTQLRKGVLKTFVLCLPILLWLQLNSNTRLQLFLFIHRAMPYQRVENVYR